MSSARAHMLADALASTRPLFDRFLDGFDEHNRTRQAPGMPNHAVWNLGHCALTMWRVRTVIGGVDVLPSGYLIRGAGAGAGPDRFDTETISFGSLPADDPGRYPTLARARVIFASAHDALVRAVRELDDASVERTIPYGMNRVPVPVRDMVMRMIFHNGTHAGQLTDLRRALGMPSVIR
ncbi:MAG: DinB family protein [Phycisphaerales bacterium]|nr:DinB family protein [Phycisphaerales bacterium]